MLESGASRTDLTGVSAEVMRKGSKSFALASLFFGRERREAAALLYHWCRYCDDTVDSAASEGERKARVVDLIRYTEAAFSAQSAPDIELPPAFQALRVVAVRYGVPKRYALDLLQAMSADSEGIRYRTLPQLIHYCYGAAGTVGLMMSHVMGISDERALPHAMSLGISMQLVNISRDVAEDLAMGRVYLPLEWLEEAGVPADRLMDPVHRDAVYGIVRRLIREAEGYRRRGEAGIPFLSFRSAIAVRSASRIYWEIARQVENSGAQALERRTVVPLAAKAMILIVATLAEVFRLPRRWISPWRATAIRDIYSFGD